MMEGGHGGGNGIGYVFDVFRGCRNREALFDRGLQGRKGETV